MPGRKLKPQFTQSDMIIDKSLSSIAAQILRSKIIKGECPQGARVTEDDFSKALGVSRASIREAFLMLENEGLIRRVHNKYTEVIKFNAQDVKEIYSVRLAIEMLCVDTCNENGNMPLDKMRSKAVALSNLVKKRKMDFFTWVDADLDYHECIIQASGNTRALRIWNDLKSQNKTLLYPIMKDDPESLLPFGVQTHEVIVETFAENQIDKGKKILYEHIKNGCNHALTLIGRTSETDTK